MELDLTEAIEAAAAPIWHESNPGYPIRDCDTWDECKKLAREVLESAAPIIERQVRQKIAADLREWLNLTDATVIHADQGQRIVFTFTQHYSERAAHELLERLHTSIPNTPIAIIVDGVEHATVESGGDVAQQLNTDGSRS